MNKLKAISLFGVLAVIVTAGAYGASQRINADSLVGSTQVEGTFYATHVDDFASNKATYTYHIKNAEGKIYDVALKDGQSIPKSGNKVQATGKIDGQTLSLSGGKLIELTNSSATSSIDASHVAAGVGKTAVILLKLPTESPTETKESVRESVFTAPNSVASYYTENSFGKYTINGEVYGWFDSAHDPRTFCGRNEGTDYNEARALAQIGDEFDHYVIVKNNCGSSGLSFTDSYRGGIRVNVNAAFPLNSEVFISTVAHEIGHNLGQSHANAYVCLTPDNKRTTLSINCGPSYTSAGMYGGGYDVMGGAHHAFHMSSIAKAKVGWLSSDQVPTVDKDGIYTLKPLERQTTGAVGLRIRDPYQYYPPPAGSPDSYSPPAEPYLYVDFRQSFGFDNFATTDAVSKGVIIEKSDGYERLGSSFFYATYTVDSTPTTDSLTDQVWLVGQTFVDPFSKLSIKVLSVSAQEAKVEVKFVPPNGSITVSIAGDEVTDTTGNLVNYSVKRKSVSSFSRTGTIVLPAKTAKISDLPPANDYIVQLSGINAKYEQSVTDYANPLPPANDVRVVSSQDKAVNFNLRKRITGDLQFIARPSRGMTPLTGSILNYELYYANPTSTLLRSGTVAGASAGYLSFSPLISYLPPGRGKYSIKISKVFDGFELDPPSETTINNLDVALGQRTTAYKSLFIREKLVDCGTLCGGIKIVATGAITGTNRNLGRYSIVSPKGNVIYSNVLSTSRKEEVYDKTNTGYKSLVPGAGYSVRWEPYSSYPLVTASATSVPLTLVANQNAAASFALKTVSDKAEVRVTLNFLNGVTGTYWPVLDRLADLEVKNQAGTVVFTGPFNYKSGSDILVRDLSPGTYTVTLKNLVGYVTTSSTNPQTVVLNGGDSASSNFQIKMAGAVVLQVHNKTGAAFPAKIADYQVKDVARQGTVIGSGALSATTARITLDKVPLSNNISATLTNVDPSLREATSASQSGINVYGGLITYFDWFFIK